MWWVPLATAAIGAASDYFGGKDQQDFNASEAKKNRAFQERMSNTSYQRAAADLEAAGLNRILALGSPASTPSGSSASAQQMPSLSNAINAGITAATAKQQIEQSKANTNLQIEQEESESMRQDLIRAQTEQAKAQTVSNAADARYTNARATKEEVGTSAYNAGKNVIDWAVEKAESVAKDFDEEAVKRDINKIIDNVHKWGSGVKTRALNLKKGKVN